MLLDLIRLQLFTDKLFQSPFHRVKECYDWCGVTANRPTRLSVPFSSGQGMLQYRGFTATSGFDVFQSPFHRVKECYSKMSKKHGFRQAR